MTFALGVLRPWHWEWNSEAKPSSVEGADLGIGSFTTFALGRYSTLRPRGSLNSTVAFTLSFLLKYLL